MASSDVSVMAQEGSGQSPYLIQEDQHVTAHACIKLHTSSSSFSFSVSSPSGSRPLALREFAKLWDCNAARLLTSSNIETHPVILSVSSLPNLAYRWRMGWRCLCSLSKSFSFSNCKHRVKLVRAVLLKHGGLRRGKCHASGDRCHASVLA